MGAFLTSLDVRGIEGSDFWMLLTPLVYAADDGTVYRVKPIDDGGCRFTTDFASIPRVFWSVVGHPAQECRKAATLHDYLYRYGRMSRKEADSLFREAMKATGVNLTRRNIYYWAVRVGGWRPWNAYRKSK